MLWKPLYSFGMTDTISKHEHLQLDRMHYWNVAEGCAKVALLQETKTLQALLYGTVVFLVVALKMIHDK